MQTTSIRQKLHQYIDNSDEKLLKMMLAMAKEYNEDDDIEFTTEDIKILDERRQKRLNGESATQTWNEVKKAIINKNNR
jgi:hypothetical protein